jgi:hypothetical protein
MIARKALTMAVLSLFAASAQAAEEQYKLGPDSLRWLWRK